MTPPGPGDGPGPCFATLRRRQDFLAAARGLRAGAPGFGLQARERAAEETAETPVRVGFTASRKVGNAVARNRAKRRLRSMARSVLAEAGRPGWDYVLIGRAVETATRPFADMEEELRQALAAVHRRAKPRR